MKYIRNLTQLTKDDASIAGGKGANLGELMRTGFSVPEGFVVLAKAFELASDGKAPAGVAEEIKTHFKKLSAPLVAVRSSATVEDGASAAWAGQFDTYLNTDEAHLIENVQNCWSSSYSSRATFYASEFSSQGNISMAVVVQRMVQSEISGVAFSVHPVTQDRDRMIIEASRGLGDKMVSGHVTPDSFVVDKKTLRVTNKEHAKEGKPVLSDEQLQELAGTVLRIEEHFGIPCDVEWAFEKGKFYITQSRPITTLADL